MQKINRKVCEVMKCEWCEERRYTMIGNKNDNKYIFCMELDYNKDSEPIMTILRQKPFNPIWEVKHTKKINYCPFCGKKINNLGDDDCEFYKRTN